MSTTTSYTLTSYPNGSATQSYSSLTKGSTITYTFKPNDGYYIKTAWVYRFKGSYLTSVVFKNGTQVQELSINSNNQATYTIQDDDLGNSLCLQTDFEKGEPPFKIPSINTIPDNTTVKIEGMNIILTPKDGYQINSATLENHDDYDEVSWSVKFTKDSNGSYKVTLPTDKQNNDSIDFLEISGDISKLIPKYTGSINCRDSNIEYSLNTDTITIKSKNGTKLSKVRASIQPYAGGSLKNITGTISENVGTIVIPQDELNNDSAVTHIYVNYIKTLENYKITDESTEKNATISVTDNTITITPKVNYKIKSAKFYTIDSYDFNKTHKNENNFSILNNIATLTFNPTNLSKTDNCYVSYETIKSETPDDLVYKNLAIKPLENTTIQFDNKHSWVLTCNNGYHINELHIDGTLLGDGTKTPDIIKPTINENKKSASFTCADKEILAFYNLSLRGDIAKDFVPPKPSTGEDITRVYVVDDDTLTKLSTENHSLYENGKTETYDFQQFINQLYKLPFSIPNSFLTTTSKIITGYYTLNAPAYKVNKFNYTLNIGSIKIPTNNGFDYNIKDISLILPWLPTVKITTSDILDKTISILYNVNLLDGSTTVVIKSNDIVIDSFKTNISTNIELFNIYSNKENGSLNSTIQNDIRQAYIKVNYFKPVENLNSYPTNEHGELSNYQGYLQTLRASVSCGTQQEQQEIENLLNGGIYIK